MNDEPGISRKLCLRFPYRRINSVKLQRFHLKHRAVSQLGISHRIYHTLSGPLSDPYVFFFVHDMRSLFEEKSVYTVMR